MGYINKAYVNNDMTRLYNAIKDSYFIKNQLWGVSLDIDWNTITTVDSGSYANLEALQTAHPTGSETTVYVVGSASPYYLYTWDGEAYVKSKTYASNKSYVTTTTKYATISFMGPSQEPYFDLTKTDVNSTVPKIVWKTYGSDSYASNNIGTTSYSPTINYCYSCKNGIIISLTGYKNGAIRIVSTSTIPASDPCLAFITPTTNGSWSDASYGFSTDQRCLCIEDVLPYSLFTMSMRNDTHYQVVPMLTNSPASVARYTEKSGFLTNAPSAARGVIKTIAINGKTYLTDGYFAIEDGEIDG